jgi:hypothetical protein
MILITLYSNIMATLYQRGLVLGNQARVISVALLSPGLEISSRQENNHQTSVNLKGKNKDLQGGFGKLNPIQIIL